MSTRPLSALVNAQGVPDIPITGITADSRSVQPGFLFVAIPGVKADGRQFIPQAIAGGAAAVVSESEETASVPVIRVQNARLALAQAAAAFYPKQPAFITAVTGTDGKTSTADFFRQLATLCGHKAASIGTLGVIGAHGEVLYPGSRTTPDPVGLHKMLHALAESGYTHICLEASSHGLDQHRLDGVRIAAAAFTNLTRDHLDYHGDEEAYFAAKARLFSDFALKKAVLNGDDPRTAWLEDICLERHVPYAIYGEKTAAKTAKKHFRILSRTPTPEGQRVTISMVRQVEPLWRRLFCKHTINLTLPLVGNFQIYNMLAATGLLLAEGKHTPAQVLSLLPQLKGVPGRLERAGIHKGGAVYVDYAHTPAALANVLQTLRPHTKGRLIVVFGCGGERDKGKRPEMGKAAAQYADIAIVTDDNPRSEDPAQIRREVLAGAPGAKEIADRRQAIYAAVDLLQAGDVLLLAGKGHETTQSINGVDHPFDDAAVAREKIG